MAPLPTVQNSPSQPNRPPSKPIQTKSFRDYFPSRPLDVERQECNATRGTQHRMYPLHRDGPAVHAERASDPTQHPMVCSRNRFRPIYPLRPLLDRPCRLCLSQFAGSTLASCRLGASPWASPLVSGASPLGFATMCQPASPEEVFRYVWCKRRTQMPPTEIVQGRWALGGRLC